MYDEFFGLPRNCITFNLVETQMFPISKMVSLKDMTLCTVKKLNPISVVWLIIIIVWLSILIFIYLPFIALILPILSGTKPRKIY